MKRTFILNPMSRGFVVQEINSAPDGYRVTIEEPKRTLDQSAHFHALCGDIAKSGFQWAGKPRNADAWKVLLVSGHAMATKEGAEVVPGIEGEFVNIRESTALMSKKRSASLIEYTLAFCAANNIPVRAREDEIPERLRA